MVFYKVAQACKQHMMLHHLQLLHVHVYIYICIFCWLSPFVAIVTLLRIACDIYLVFSVIANVKCSPDDTCLLEHHTYNIHVHVHPILSAQYL